MLGKRLPNRTSIRGGLAKWLGRLRVLIFGPERVVEWRILKGDYWFSGYYDFNTEYPNTTYTRTFRNRPISSTDVPNPFYWPGLAERVRQEMADEFDPKDIDDEDLLP